MATFNRATRSGLKVNMKVEIISGIYKGKVGTITHIIDYEDIMLDFDEDVTCPPDNEYCIEFEDGKAKRFNESQFKLYKEKFISKVVTENAWTRKLVIK